MNDALALASLLADTAAREASPKGAARYTPGPFRKPAEQARFRLPPAWNTCPVNGKRALGSTWQVLRRALAEARDDDVPMVAQALAYSLFLAIPAAALLALGIFSLVADAGTVEELVGRMQTVMPEEATTLLRQSLERSTQSHGGGIAMTVVGLVLALGRRPPRPRRSCPRRRRRSIGRIGGDSSESDWWRS